jgi:hypothetical protein
MRDVLVNVGISQVSAKLRVTPGGYEDNPIVTPH